jgi:hypothetical protein
MSVKNYDLLIHQVVSDASWSVHKPGCAAIPKEAEVHASLVENGVELDLDGEEEMMNAIDIDKLGYTAADVKVHSCVQDV